MFVNQFSYQREKKLHSNSPRCFCIELFKKNSLITNFELIVSYFLALNSFFSFSRLHSNNLYCDCHLAWLSDWLRQRPRVGLYTQCMGPSHLRGHNVAEVQKREFVCSGKISEVTAFFSLLHYWVTGVRNSNVQGSDFFSSETSLFIPMDTLFSPS